MHFGDVGTYDIKLSTESSCFLFTAVLRLRMSSSLCCLNAFDRMLYKYPTSMVINSCLIPEQTKQLLHSYIAGQLNAFKLEYLREIKQINQNVLTFVVRMLTL